MEKTKSTFVNCIALLYCIIIDLFWRGSRGVSKTPPLRLRRGVWDPPCADPPLFISSGKFTRTRNPCHGYGHGQDVFWV